MVKKISAFNLEEGSILSSKYRVERKIGSGWEGEVYIVKELITGIERAAKIFYPQRNKGNKTARIYAKKLFKLRHCSVLIQYITQEIFWFNGEKITYLISEFVEGEVLSEFVKRQKSGRIPSFQALHLIHALAKGMEEVHLRRDYHGDLHSDNVMVTRSGLGFDLKLIDMFHWGGATPENIREDVINIVRILYDVIGGAKHYGKQPEPIKSIICGLKRTLILKKFRTAGQLRVYLENLEWD